MDWLEKVRYLKAKKEKDGYGGKYLIDIRAHEPKWVPGELDKLIEPYPWLPDSYINFIKEFDKIGISFCFFYSSKEANSISLSEEIDYFQPIIGMDYFPFGKDPSGSLFAIDTKGYIWFFDEGDGFETKEKYADSFEEFVGECLMGKRYHEFNTIEGDRYYALLQSLGWA